MVMQVSGVVWGGSTWANDALSALQQRRRTGLCQTHTQQPAVWGLCDSGPVWLSVGVLLCCGCRPNMGGKSVLIRQAALTIILAQVGAAAVASIAELTQRMVPGTPVSPLSHNKHPGGICMAFPSLQ
jgi:hypothetical protein